MHTSLLPAPTGQQIAAVDWHELAFWVLGSILIYALATLLLWLALRGSGSGAARLRGFLQSAGGVILAWLLRLLWLLLPGFAALVLGILSPRLMGITQIDWGASFGFGALFALVALAVLLAAGLSYRRVHPLPRPYPSITVALALSIRLLLEAGALQWHWAFYRSAVIGWADAGGLVNPIYWGTWLAVALICLEGALSPLLWRDLRIVGLAERRVLRGVLLIATSVMYLLSRNFWLLWALHAVAVILLEPRLGQAPDNEKGSWELESHQQPS